MRKIVRNVLCIALAAVVGVGFLAGCGSSTSSSSTTSSSSSSSASKKIAIVCDSAGQNDNGYNQSAVEAAKAEGQKYGWDVKVVEPTNGVPDALESLGEDGYDVVFNMAYDFDALIDGVGGSKAIAEQYPNTEWVVFNDNPNVNTDGSVKHKNVISVMFDVNESSYVAGALSVLVNENASTLFGSGYNFTPLDQGGRAVGFIGGSNSNGITVFSYGYIQGVNYEAQKLGVTYDYYAKYDAGFTDSAVGSTVAGTYFSNGANIVYGCAGNVGTGVTSKAKEVGKLAIQVDADKDAQQPGYILTSVLKNTKVPVNEICEALNGGSLSSVANLKEYSLSSGAVGITDLSTISQYITTDAGKAKWEEIKSEIKDLEGKVGTSITVVNAQNGDTFDPASCPNVTIK